jgi:hypothetical protein
MIAKKFILTEEEKEYEGRTLYRIQAIRAFGDIKNGDIGGWVESEDNLSHEGNAWVSDNAMVCNNAWVYGNAKIYGNALVSANARVGENAQIYGNAWVRSYAGVYGNAMIYDDAWVSGNVNIYGVVDVCGNAYVCDRADYLVFKNWWSSGRYFTWTRSNNKWKVGCFYGTGDELIQKAYADSKKSGREYERIVKYVESILADEKEESRHN